MANHRDRPDIQDLNIKDRAGLDIRVQYDHDLKIARVTFTDGPRSRSIQSVLNKSETLDFIYSLHRLVDWLDDVST